MLPDLIKAVPLDAVQTQNVTRVQTICDIVNENTSTKTMLSEVHKLLKIYLTIATYPSQQQHQLLGSQDNNSADNFLLQFAIAFTMLHTREDGKYQPHTLFRPYNSCPPQYKIASYFSVYITIVLYLASYNTKSY